MRERLFSLTRFFMKVMIDILSFFLAFFLALVVRQWVPALLESFSLHALSSAFYPPLSDFSFLRELWWVPIIFFCILLYYRLYSVRYPFWEETRLIFKSVVVFMLFLIFAFAFKKVSSGVSRSLIILLGIFLILLLPIFRYFGKRLMNRMGLWTEAVLIIGAGKAGRLTLKGLLEEPHLGYEVKGFLDDDPAKQGQVIEIKGKFLKIYGPIDHFRKFCDMLKIRTIFICVPSLEEEKLGLLVNKIYRYVDRVVVVPEIGGLALFDSKMHYLFLERIFFLKLNNNLHSATNRLMKRLFDLSVALVLVPFILPVLAILAILVRLDSKGPVFFIQKRMGLNHRPFYLLKFRTMYAEGDRILEEYLQDHKEAEKEWKEYKKLKNYDPRITKVGHLLRKTSLDELPQIFNILLGHMSLVGPRPYLHREKQDMEGNEDKILMTKPGITGLWQVSGRNDLVFLDRVDLDSWYVDNWSLWLDMMILIQTISVVLKRKGAY